MSAPPELATWAADCAERALDRLGGVDPRPREAVAAARAWADDPTATAAGIEAALAAQAAARDADDAGHRALAAAYRAAASAAASGEAPDQAVAAARLAVEALTLNSAVCEADTNADVERRRQWESLPAHLRPLVFDAEPPEPGTAACAV